MVHNNCRDNLFNNLQKEFIIQKYNIYGISGCSYIGNRKIQEDSLIIDVHPSKEEIYLIGIADGMGGLLNGAMASNISLKLLTLWFENLSIDNIYNDRIILEKIKKIVLLLDEIIRKQCVNGGTTLAFSIIRDDSSICINIGDSRIYCKTNNMFYQLSSDQSLGWDLLEKNIIPSKNAVMFYKHNNLITSRIGCEKKKIQIEEKIIDNDQYDALYIFSDGITDCITDEQLESVVFNSQCSAYSIVAESLENSLIQNYLNYEYYNNVVNGGKDNSTAIVYYKKRRKI